MGRGVTYYEIGITGTGDGATKRQLLIALDLVKKAYLEHGPVRIHEGDCIGFDAELTSEVLRWRAHENFWVSQVMICGHPPLNDSKRAHVHCDIEMTPAGYLDRDREIVRHGEDLVIAAPKSLKYAVRGGTNYTTKLSVRSERNVQVVLSTGTIISGADFVERR